MYTLIWVMEFRVLYHQTIIFTGKMVVFIGDGQCVLWSQNVCRKYSFQRSLEPNFKNFPLGAYYGSTSRDTDSVFWVVDSNFLLSDRSSVFAQIRFFKQWSVFSETSWFLIILLYADFFTEIFFPADFCKIFFRFYCWRTKVMKLFWKIHFQ